MRVVHADLHVESMLTSKELYPVQRVQYVWSRLKNEKWLDKLLFFVFVAEISKYYTRNSDESKVLADDLFEQ